MRMRERSIRGWIDLNVARGWSKIYVHRGFLLKIVPHPHAVGHHDRCNQIIEPYISPQWYLKRQNRSRNVRLKRRKRGEIVFLPGT